MSKLRTNNAISDNAKVASISPIVKGNPLSIGAGFTALTFREGKFEQLMDPFVLVDHYKMTMSTFGEHPHAGLSAVSVLFEDSEGKFHNRDSLGNDIDILPGDLYWLKAGAGALHDEAPRANSYIHGLQVFVNLPTEHKQDVPTSKHVAAKDMPVIENNGARVRIVLGESNNISGPTSPALPMTILDGTISQGAIFQHAVNAQENAWVYAVRSDIVVKTVDQSIPLKVGESIAISNQLSDAQQTIEISTISTKKAHFVLFAAMPINEPFVQKGPFIMSNEQEIQQVEKKYAAGLFGRLD